MALLADLFRTAVTFAGAVVMTIVCAAAVMIVSRLSPRSHAVERIIRLWSRTWLLLSGTRLRVVGGENVDTSRSYVVVANHESAFDIMACFLALPVPIRFLAKKELFRIPILAQGMRAIGIVEVDRQARIAIHEQLNAQAKELIAAGRSVIIYRAGRGPASWGHSKRVRSPGIGPSSPVAIDGTRRGSRVPSIRGGREITVEILPPIETDECGDANELRNPVMSSPGHLPVVDPGE